MQAFSQQAKQVNSKVKQMMENASEFRGFGVNIHDDTKTLSLPSKIRDYATSNNGSDASYLTDPSNNKKKEIGFNHNLQNYNSLIGKPNITNPAQ